jgi:hypothetical protein
MIPKDAYGCFCAIWRTFCVNEIVLFIDNKHKTPNGLFQSDFTIDFDLVEGTSHLSESHCEQLHLEEGAVNLQPLVFAHIPMVMPVDPNDFIDTSCEAE